MGFKERLTAFGTQGVKRQEQGKGLLEAVAPYQNVILEQPGGIRDQNFPGKPRFILEKILPIQDITGENVIAFLAEFRHQMSTSGAWFPYDRPLWEVREQGVEGFGRTLKVNVVRSLPPRKAVHFETLMAYVNF